MPAKDDEVADSIGAVLDTLRWIAAPLVRIDASKKSEGKEEKGRFNAAPPPMVTSSLMSGFGASKTS